jgi:hypothetical protein
MRRTAHPERAALRATIMPGDRAGHVWKFLVEAQLNICADAISAL